MTYSGTPLAYEHEGRYPRSNADGRAWVPGLHRVEVEQLLLRWPETPSHTS
jgi:hypothetical protein